jgi:hypothetical protein
MAAILVRLPGSNMHGGKDMTLEEHLAVPYLMAVESFEDEDRQWRRRAWLPELPGCSVVGDSAVELVERLEAARIGRVSEMYARGEDGPIPRRPLRSGWIWLFPAVG